MGTNKGYVAGRKGMSADQKYDAVVAPGRVACRKRHAKRTCFPMLMIVFIFNGAQLSTQNVTIDAHEGQIS